MPIFKIKNLIPSKNIPQGPGLVVLGSSSSEVFDYIFGDNKDYFPYWAGGWSARGLIKEEYEAYIKKIMLDIPRSSNIFLNFGCADTAFNLRHMAAKKGIYDFKSTLFEAADGIEKCKKILNSMGFRNVYSVFISPMISLPQTYWSKQNPIRQLPDRMLGKFYFDLFQEVSRRIPTIDLFDEVSDVKSGSYLLKKEFKRIYHNHHPDYIKIQHIVYNKISSVPGMLPMREIPLEESYKHTMAPIKELLASGTTRKRTC